MAINFDQDLKLSILLKNFLYKFEFSLALIAYCSICKVYMLVDIKSLNHNNRPVYL